MEKEEKKQLEPTITINLKGHKFEVNFPDTGKLIDLEQRKSRLSPPMSTASSLWAYNLGLAITTFRILIPQMEGKLNVDSFEKLSVKESSEIVKVYLNQFKPWFDAWIEEASSIFDDE